MLKRFPRPTHLSPLKWRGLFLFLLLLLVLTSAVSVVHVQHKIRLLETQYYLSLQEALAAREEWGRLLLEKKFLTSPARVEQIAKSELHMTSDKSNVQIIYLEGTLPEFESE